MKTLYNDMLDGMENGQNIWASQNVLVFSYVWNNQEMLYFNKIGHLMKSRIIADFLQK